MSTYEMIVVLDGQLSDEAISAELSKVESLITEGGGEITHRDEWGKRRLAFPINGQVDGHYSVWVFTHTGRSPKVLHEIERVSRLNEAILRHLVIRQPKTKKPMPVVTKPDATADARPDWGGARRGWRPPYRRPADGERRDDRGGDRPDRRPPDSESPSAVPSETPAAPAATEPPAAPVATEPPAAPAATEPPAAPAAETPPREE